ncbi:thioesterase domain-containing protein [Planotetraspora sp. A-T 1434]|uniref:thioesterase II family protein n=1 Tax=Planotetraspora sp. A-T 1434 TaxID=2979219 RepID=UPI0021BFBE81|nr:thioesterase domain-containing protein [Planotetraspora sp. A-T 1434]MCT9933195.1 thioesterase domain-containing protein [Planotetraspora sp. A-T 1434]
MVTQSSWYVTFEPRPAARVRLYGLPFAGGGASMFRQWSRHLPSWVELRAIRLPGRQGRHRQAAFTDCEQAAGWLAETLAREASGDRARGLAGESAGGLAGDGVPWALFGHSMGAMLSYRLTRAFQAGHGNGNGNGNGGTLPVLLALASWPIRGAAEIGMPDPALSDDEFVAALRILGGLPPEMAEDPDALALTLPVARADFTLCHSYVYRPEPPLPVPVAAFGGTEDIVAPPESLIEWKDQTDDFLGLRLFSGGHFFLRDHLPALAASIADDLAQVLDRHGR